MREQALQKGPHILSEGLLDDRGKLLNPPTDRATLREFLCRIWYLCWNLTIFELEGLGSEKRKYLRWLLAQSVAPTAVVKALLNRRE